MRLCHALPLLFIVGIVITNAAADNKCKTYQLSKLKNDFKAANVLGAISKLKHEYIPHLQAAFEKQKKRKAAVKKIRHYVKATLIVCLHASREFAKTKKESKVRKTICKEKNLLESGRIKTQIVKFEGILHSMEKEYKKALRCFKKNHQVSKEIRKMADKAKVMPHLKKTLTAVFRLARSNIPNSF